MGKIQKPSKAARNLIAQVVYRCHEDGMSRAEICALLHREARALEGRRQEPEPNQAERPGD